jgi:asparagine synthase (glutamine-hydrolysing)
VYQTQFGPLLEHTNNNILREYQNTYLLDDVLTKVDRASMQKALEVRSPFLGKEVVEFANSLPYEWKLKGWTTKYILKELMKDKLPEQIVNRKKKGFAVPVAVWFKKELRPLLLDYLDTETVKSEGIFNSFYTDKLVNEHLDGKRNHAKRLWTLLMFQMWQRKYLG